MIAPEIWNFVKDCLNEFPQLEQLIESLLRVLKKAVTLMPNTFQPHITELLQIVIGKFDEHPFSTYIFAIEICFSQF